jgi:hypothetical protein
MLATEAPMVHISEIQSQLTRLGVHLSRWFTPELKELQQIMMDNEKIIAAAPGRYFSGFALLVATDLRLLLIDKRAFFMTVEDTRYDMVSEVVFSSRLYDATVHIFTLNKQHNFTSIKYKKQLRTLCGYVQQRVWELRQVQNQPDAPVAAPVQSSVSPPLATASNAGLPDVSHALRVPHIPHPPKPHLPRHIGFAAVNGSRRFSPNAYTNHLTAAHRGVATLS